MSDIVNAPPPRDEIAEVIFGVEDSDRKPRAGPLIEPAEAIAIALSMLPAKSTGNICSPDSAAVRLVLQSLKLAGWKIEPR